MTQQADGQVLIRAELDTASVTAGIAQLQSALDELRTHAARQSASSRSGGQAEGSTLITWMPGLASRLVGALSSGLTGGSTRITGALRGALASALSDGNTYVPRFSAIGSQIIAGIIGGIQGSASALWNTLREVAANMLSTLKSALGIHSPSQLMREEIGWQIGAGMAEGILDRRAEVASAAEILAGTAIAGSGTAIADSARAGGASAENVGRTHRVGAAAVGMAGAMLHAAAASPALNTVRGTPAVTGYGSRSSEGSRAASVTGGNTFIFQKPVETPYRHAQAIREVMEEMLYGT